MTDPGYPTSPSVGERVAFTGLAVIVALLPQVLMLALGSSDVLDFYQHWAAARALLDGENPYAVMGANGTGSTYLYPLPTALLHIPLAVLPEPLARFLFVGGSAALLGWVASKQGTLMAPMILSGAFFYSCAIAQLSPLLTATALLPALGALAFLKPQLGAALTVGASNVKYVISAAVGSSAVFLATLLIQPGWPAEWIDVLRHRSYDLHESLLVVPGGALLLLALIRFRDPGARLIAALGCVPQTGLLYDTLPLFLVCRNRAQGWFLSVSSTIVLAIHLHYLLEAARSGLGELESLILVRDATRPFLLWMMYIPAMIIVLWQPEESKVRCGVHHSHGG